MASEEEGGGVPAARAEAKAALPPGWTLQRADEELWSAPGGGLSTWGASAIGPAREVQMALALTHAEAYRALGRRLRGELQVTEAWAPPVPPGKRGVVSRLLFGGGDEPYDDPADEVARQELLATLPPGWRFDRTNSETHGVPGAKMTPHCAIAAGPDGEVAMAISLDRRSALRHLARRLRGELEVTEAWAPPAYTGSAEE